MNDDRWLIHDVVGLARRAGARWLLLENVSGLYSANEGEALGQVADALAEGGFDAEWASLRASAVGACHQRLRWFCLATPSQDANGEPRTQRRLSASEGPCPPAFRFNTSRRGGASADLTLLPTPTANQPGGTAEQHLARKRDGKMNRTDPSVTDLRMALEVLPTPTLGDSKASGSAAYAATDTHNVGVTLTDATQRGLVDWSVYGPAISRHERCVTHRDAPSPLTAEGRLSPHLVEWMMGLPEGHVTDVPGLSRAQQLGRLGNGVVPQQAAAAITALAQRFAAVPIAPPNYSTGQETTPK